MVTDSNGQAVAKGFQPNAEAGKFQIQVEASYQNLTATTTINQVNAVLTTAAAGGISAKLIVVLAIVGGAAAGGVIAATSGGSNGGGPPAQPPAAGPTPTTITPGTPGVGAP